MSNIASKNNLDSFLKAVPEGMRPKLEVRDRETSRTTLKLNADAWNAVERISSDYGLTQKQVIEQAIDLLAVLIGRWQKEQKNLGEVISLFRINGDEKSAKEIGSRKTVALSNSCMVSIDLLVNTIKKVCSNLSVTRDALVQAAVITYETLVSIEEKEIEKRHAKAREVVGRCWESVEQFEKELETFLPEDDPILQRFGLVVVLAMNLAQEIDSALKNKTPIDPNGL